MRFLVVAAVLAALTPLASAERVKVAVVPTITVHLDPAQVDALSQELAEALRAELDVDAIGGVEVRRRLPGEGLAADCVANPSCIADTAQRLSAQQLLFVVLIETGSGGPVQIDASWVDAVAHKSASRPSLTIASLADARAQLAAAAQQLLPDAPVRARPQAGIGRISEAVPRHFAIPSYATAGAAVLGLGTGLSLGLVTRSRYHDCEDEARAGAACSSGRKDSIRRLALVADVGWAIAIGGAVATAVLYATSGESARLIVEPTPGGAALTATGRF